MNYSKDNIKPNDLYNRLRCPTCKFDFISGFDEHTRRKCPSCHRSFSIKSKLTGHCGTGSEPCQIDQEWNGHNNNYYRDNCPALMSDGRFLTNHRSSSELTDTMRKINGFNSANKFRTFMQANADLLIAAEHAHLLRQNACNPTVACSEGWRDLWTKKGGHWQQNM